jgi:hypothetical protein
LLASGAKHFGRQSASSVEIASVREACLALTLSRSPPNCSEPVFADGMMGNCESPSQVNLIGKIRRRKRMTHGEQTGTAQIGFAGKLWKPAIS